MANIDKPGLAWVTGASSGIGKALSFALAERGWTVIASARSASKLEAIAASETSHGRIIPLSVDVTDAAGVAVAVARIIAEHGDIDLAILNAGTHLPISIENFDRDKVQSLVDTNLMGTVNCLSALLPYCLERRGGEIAVVASMTGYRGLPTASAYGATKAALINMCEALRPELELHDVSIRLINPGFIDTPLTRLNRFRMPFLISAEAGAAAMLRGLRTRRFEITTPRRMAFGMKILRIMPNWLFLAIARRITPEPARNAADEGTG